MADQKRKVLRCAIYTRKSSEEGLEQDFNSLHAQREACLAFIASQKHGGWTALTAAYDDSGISGGTMQRPALQRLLTDVASGAIDIVVVYKIDRLTRSLLDFAKIVEVFDRRNVSFVSVTQQFSTTSSMGRLTLNVLLSFAQFEREVTGERIRDKIAASKKKGMWMGGFVPLGYRANERTLAIEEAEATTVRTIFALYLSLKNVRLVEAELARRGLVTKRYISKTGTTSGGRTFSRGHIYRVLANPIYAGDIAHRGQRHTGMHPAIIDRETFESAQARLATNGHSHRARDNARSPSLLAGILFDAAGNRMFATHSGKTGRRYRYYVGKASQGSGARGTMRIAASEIEQLVVRECVALLTDEQRLLASALSGNQASHVDRILAHGRRLAAGLENGTASEQRQILGNVVERIVLAGQEVRIEVSRTGLLKCLSDESHASYGDGTPIQIESPVAFGRRSGRSRILTQITPSRVAAPVADAALLKAVARGHVWLEELTSGRADSIIEIAERERVSDRFVSVVLNLAFFSPDLIQQIADCKQGAGITAKALMVAGAVPANWSHHGFATVGGFGAWHSL